MKPQITGIHHVALKCRGIENFERTVHFYRDLLGLSVVRTWGTAEAPGIMLDTGAGIMEITANATDTPGEGALRHIAFAVNDVDAFAQLVQKNGYRITIEPKDICFSSVPPYPARISFCEGPTGEAVEFFAAK